MRGYLKVAGLALFVLAFFLQAVTLKGSGPGSGAISGWVCALVAIIATGGIFKTGMQTLDAQIVFLALSGLVNPLVLIYLGFSFRERFARLRAGLAIAISACLASTWVFFCLAKYLPREGHVLWVLGIGLILGAGTTLRRTASAQ